MSTHAELAAKYYIGSLSGITKGRLEVKTRTIHKLFENALMNHLKVSPIMHTSYWRHNGCDSVWNHQPHDCLLKRFLRTRSKKQQSSASLAFVQGIHRRMLNTPHKWPVTRKMFPFLYEIRSLYVYVRVCVCKLDIAIWSIHTEKCFSAVSSTLANREELVQYEISVLLI